MNIFSQIINIRKEDGNHGKNFSERNRRALNFLLENGFPIDRLRKRLFDMSGLTVARLANGVAVPTIYQAIKGRSENLKAEAFDEPIPYRAQVATFTIPDDIFGGRLF